MERRAEAKMGEFNLAHPGNMSRRSRLDYAYAVGRVRALEKYLIPWPVFLEAVEASEVASGLKILYEAGQWSQEIPRASTPEDVDRLSRHELARLEQVMTELLEPDIYALFSEKLPLAQRLEQAQNIGYLFFIDYVRHCLDLANIKTFLRFHYRQTKEKLEESLLPGGFLDPKIFKRHFESSAPDLYPLLAKTEYESIWVKAWQGIEEKNTFVILEREIENYLINYLRRAKEIVFGPEPVFVYGQARRREVHLFRLIAIGRMLQLPPEWLKLRMSETYV